MEIEPPWQLVPGEPADHHNTTQSCVGFLKEHNLQTLSQLLNLFKGIRIFRNVIYQNPLGLRHSTSDTKLKSKRQMYHYFTIQIQLWHEDTQTRDKCPYCFTFTVALCSFLQQRIPIRIHNYWSASIRVPVYLDIIKHDIRRDFPVHRDKIIPSMHDQFCLFLPCLCVHPCTYPCTVVNPYTPISTYFHPFKP